MVGTARCLHSFVGRSGTDSLWVPRGVSSRAEPSNPSDSPPTPQAPLLAFLAPLPHLPHYITCAPCDELLNLGLCPSLGRWGDQANLRSLQKVMKVL